MCRFAPSRFTAPRTNSDCNPARGNDDLGDAVKPRRPERTGPDQATDRDGGLAGVRALVPKGVSFDDLQFRLDPHTGELSFDAGVLRRLSEHSGIDWSWLTGKDERIVALLLGWYLSHRNGGGSVNMLAEQLQAYTEAKRLAGPMRVQRGSPRIQ
jgi:hypothetical protein